MHAGDTSQCWLCLLTFEAFIVTVQPHDSWTLMKCQHLCLCVYAHLGILAYVHLPTFFNVSLPCIMSRNLAKLNKELNRATEGGHIIEWTLHEITLISCKRKIRLGHFLEIKICNFSNLYLNSIERFSSQVVKPCWFVMHHSLYTWCTQLIYWHICYLKQDGWLHLAIKAKQGDEAASACGSGWLIKRLELPLVDKGVLGSWHNLCFSVCWPSALWQPCCRKYCQHWV